MSSPRSNIGRSPQYDDIQKHYQQAKNCEFKIDPQGAKYHYDQMLDLIPSNSNEYAKEINDSKIMNISVLMNYMINSGSEFNGIQVEQFSEGYRGLKSSRFIRKGEIVMVIPLRSLITNSEAESDGYCCMLRDLQFENDFAVNLALYILEILECPDHPLNLWVNTLPSNFDSNPRYFSDDLLKKLTGSPVLIKIQNLIQNVEEKYNDIKRLIPSFPHSFEHFKWAHTCVCTRVYCVFINGKKDTVFAPISDLANHSNDPNTEWSFDSSKNSFVVTALKDIRENEPIYESYGVKPNYTYFSNYGFVVKDQGCKYDETFLIFDDELRNKLLKGDCSTFDYQNMHKIGYTSDKFKETYTYCISKWGFEDGLENIKEACLKASMMYNDAINDNKNLLEQYKDDFVLSNIYTTTLNDKKLLVYHYALAKLILDGDIDTIKDKFSNNVVDFVEKLDQIDAYVQKRRSRSPLAQINNL